MTLNQLLSVKKLGRGKNLTMEGLMFPGQRVFSPPRTLFVRKRRVNDKNGHTNAVWALRVYPM